MLVAMAPLCAGVESVGEEAHVDGDPPTRIESDVPGAADLSAQFRDLDRTWRNAPATLEQPWVRRLVISALSSLAETLAVPGGRPPRLWAEVHESLGDYYLTRAADRVTALWHFEKALAWWGGSREIEPARERYLNIVWRLSTESGDAETVYPLVPMRLLENARALAETPEERARVHLLLARAYRRLPGRLQQPERIRAEFEHALAADPGGERYVKILFHFAEWAATAGTAFFDDQGDPLLEPDYELALDCYARIIAADPGGESQDRARAERAIEAIRRPVLEIGVPVTYPPGTEPQIHLRWRNLESVRVRVFPIQLTESPGLDERFSESDRWVERLTVPADLDPVITAELDLSPRLPHYYGEEVLRLSDELQDGAYLVRASDPDGGTNARELLLISDAVLVVMMRPRHLHGYLADAVTGAPIPDAPVRVWQAERPPASGEPASRAGIRLRTDGSGLFSLEFSEQKKESQLLVVAGSGLRQGFATASISPEESIPADAVLAYAFAARPQYKIGDTVHWKAILRRGDSRGYTVLRTTDLAWRIFDPLERIVAEGVDDSSAHGSVHGALELGSGWAEGVYRIAFSPPHSEAWTTPTEVFRVEGYRHRELQMNLTLHSGSTLDPGAVLSGAVQVAFRASDEPVSQAPIDLTIVKRPFDYNPGTVNLSGDEDSDASPLAGEVVYRETVESDPRGLAGFYYETSLRVDRDYEYRVRARMADSSGRVLRAERVAWVTRLGHHAEVRVPHRIFRPNEPVDLSITTRDAGGEAVSVAGVLRITREEWREVWVDRRGREISGRELRQLRGRSGGFFSFGPSPGDYMLEREGYDVDEVTVLSLETDADGRLIHRFVPLDQGYYRFSWISRDLKNAPVKADTAIWVAEPERTDIGYRGSGLEVIVDRDAVRTGTQLPIIVSTPGTHGYVLFSVDRGTLSGVRTLQMEGTAALLNIPIGLEHVPNVFFNAVMVSEQQVIYDRREISVIAGDRSIEVILEPDADGYHPGASGRFEILVRDHAGDPVPNVDLALAVVPMDSAEELLPEDARAIRDFFYDRRVAYAGTMVTSLDERPFFRLRSDTAAAASTDRGTIIRRAAAVSRNRENRVRGATEDTALRPGPQEDVVATAALWIPELQSDEAGRAVAEVRFPNERMNWRAVVWAVDSETRVGQGIAEVSTRMPLTARLQHPRFLVTGDHTTITAVLQNKTHDPMHADVRLVSEEESRMEVSDARRTVTIDPHGFQRLEWEARAAATGPVGLTLAVDAGRYSDRVSEVIEIREPGLVRWSSVGGRLSAERILVHPEFRDGEPGAPGRLEVFASPGLAAVLVESVAAQISAADSRVESPAGSVAATAAVAHALERTGFDRGRVEERLGSEISGVGSGFELERWLAERVHEIAGNRSEAGGWGWIPGAEPDSATTAYALWALTLAAQMNIPVCESALEAARIWLNRALVDHRDSAAVQAWMLHALALNALRDAEQRPTRFEARTFVSLMRNREVLSNAARGHLALAARFFGFDEDARLLVEELRAFVRREVNPDHRIFLADSRTADPVAAVIPRAFWPGGDELAGDGSAIEATALGLWTLLEADPGHELVDPIVAWLLARRENRDWGDARASAIATVALSRYLFLNDKMDSTLAFEVTVNGRVLSEERVTVENILDRRSRFEVPPAWVETDSNTIVFRRLEGSGPLNFNVRSGREVALPDRHLEGDPLAVRRAYNRIIERQTLLEGYVEERIPLLEGEPIRVGDRIESVLRVTAETDIPYLRFEDFRAAGLEIIRPPGTDVWARFTPLVPHHEHTGPTPTAVRNQAAIEETIAFYPDFGPSSLRGYLDRLPEGIWEFRYRLRAEHAGAFHIRPTVVEAVHAPAIRADSDPRQIVVE